MAASFLVFGLYIFLLPIVSYEIDLVYQAHYKYEIERSLQSALRSSFMYETETSVFNEFKEVFIYQCPKEFEYKISLVNFELNPKFIHFEVSATNNRGHELTVESSMIEEVKNEYR